MCACGLCDEQQDGRHDIAAAACADLAPGCCACVEQGVSQAGRLVKPGHFPAQERLSEGKRLFRVRIGFPTAAAVCHGGAAAMLRHAEPSYICKVQAWPPASVLCPQAVNLWDPPSNAEALQGNVTAKAASQHAQVDNVCIARFHFICRTRVLTGNERLQRESCG